MKINNIQIAKKNIKVVPLNLCFDNLHFNYTPGRVIVESKAERENSKALRNLTKFATLMVDDCTLNESNGSNTIFVSSYVSGKKNLLRLYEWVKKYVGIQNINKVAPGLLEALEIENEDNSVALRFAKYRKLYEGSDSENSNEDDDNNDEDDDNNDEDNNDEKDESEEDELTAVIIEVAKGDEDDAKEELIDAGVDEDDIEIIDDDEDEDEDNEEEDNKEKDVDEEESLDEEDEENDEEEKENSETVKIRIAVDSFKALKDYLEGKGFNLEDELGGEIIIDDEDEDNDNKDNDDEESDDEFTEFDDLDLFGDEENEKIKDKEK